MADHYVSDDEQAEAVKRWLRTNGPAIGTGIVLGLAIIFGWQYWNNYQTTQSEQASLNYDTLTVAVERGEGEIVRQLGQQLQDDYPDLTYSALGTLMVARFEVEQNDLKAAIEQLQWVLDNSDQPELQSIARLRLARLLLADGQLDAAEQQLDALDSPHFTLEREEMRGDLYLAREQPDQARTAYEAALAAAEGAAGNRLQLKLDALAVAG